MHKLQTWDRGSTLPISIKSYAQFRLTRGESIKKKRAMRLYTLTFGYNVFYPTVSSNRSSEQIHCINKKKKKKKKKKPEGKCIRTSVWGSNIFFVELKVGNSVSW